MTSNKQKMDEVVLVDGVEVPSVCVKAIDDLETSQPGSSFVGARLAIAAAVLKADKSYREK